MDVLDKIKQFTKLNVLVIGDIILDRYLYGNTKRISPEAPVPVVHLNDSENRLGGAANVALNLKELGASVDIIGIIGDDQYGLDTLSLLAENNINSDNIRYLNRLSDALFVWSRWVSKIIGDEENLWDPDQ